MLITSCQHRPSRLLTTLIAFATALAAVLLIAGAPVANAATVDRQTYEDQFAGGATDEYNGCFTTTRR